MTNKVLVVSLDKKFRRLERQIKKTGTEILKILKQKNAEVKIYLAGNAVMKSLNKKLRGKDKIANILSFEEPKKFISPELKFKKIGEIFLNVDNPSAGGDKNFSKEFLLIHGILHLLGYDHMKKSDAIKMEVKEKLVSKKIKN